MIVVETSAVVAILLSEPERDAFAKAVVDADSRLLPVSCYVESVMVPSQQRNGRKLLERFIQDFDLTLFGSDPRQARLAADAFEQYGRGTGHPARLNFGDCLSYAAAKALNAPLLFKGDDFVQTDVRSASV